ncbi:mechanosensitive ion channel [soil metagenome]
MEIFDIKLVGISAESGQKLLFTIGLILFVVFAGRLASWITGLILNRIQQERARFWTRQVISVIAAAILILGLLSIWFDDPVRLATGIGLVTAGLAFALQRLVTAIAGYFVILRGETFSIGDRVSIGPVRGDVVALSFTQTTIMEMGQPAAMTATPPPIWIQSRQYTGRVVTVSNAMIFEEPVYNYSKDFPYLWDEIALVVPFDADWKQGERNLLDIAERHTIHINEMSREALETMQRKYFVQEATIEPRVYVRIVEGGVELTVRFIVAERGSRDIKDAANRDILSAFEEAGIEFADPTLEITSVPPIQIRGGKQPESTGR